MPLPMSPVCTNDPKPAPTPANAGTDIAPRVAPSAPEPASAGSPKLNSRGRTI